MRAYPQLAEPTAPRVMIYSQDGLGLGHMRRTNSIAARLLELRPEASVLTLVDSPLGQFFETPPNHDCVKLPSIVKHAPGEWRPASLGVPFTDVLQMRKELIRSAVTTFRPHVLLVDHMPRGAMGELLPALQRLKATRASTKIVLGLRDILDAPEVVRRIWAQEHTCEAIERFYDSVLVYGQREVFDFAQAYGLPARVGRLLHYCGYVCTPAAARYASRVRMENLAGTAKGTRLIVAMAGGGADAYPMMRAVLDALPLVRTQQPVVLVMITGPFMPANLRRALQARVEDLPARVRISVSDSLSYIDAADLVIAMAGYNTTMEIMRSGKPAILIPRVGPSAEQRMRAALFARRRWVHNVDPRQLNPQQISATITTALAQTESARHSNPPDLNGLDTAVNHLLFMLDERSLQGSAANATSLFTEDGMDQDLYAARHGLAVC